MTMAIFHQRIGSVEISFSIDDQLDLCGLDLPDHEIVRSITSDVLVEFSDKIDAIAALAGPAALTVSAVLASISLSVSLLEVYGKVDERAAPIMQDILIDAVRIGRIAVGDDSDTHAVPLIVVALTDLSLAVKKRVVGNMLQKAKPCAH
jgi:hypothetical protein